MNYAELTLFFHDLVTTAQSKGIRCAITSGMACVAMRVALSTKDCDLLCEPDAVAAYLEILASTKYRDTTCRYRGRISPPLDARWLSGGWTSHFNWAVPGTEAHLDVFGVPPRASHAWQSELRGLYAGPHTVAEMKRTDRAKDWDFATSLGMLMLDQGDMRGWLHLFDAESLLDVARKVSCPADIVSQRPTLELLLTKDSRLEDALHAEIGFWHELDRVRLHIYQHAVRPYLVAVRRTVPRHGIELRDEHVLRIAAAEAHLAKRPLHDFGVERMIVEARERLSRRTFPEYMAWLPDVRPFFQEHLA